MAYDMALGWMGWRIINGAMAEKQAVGIGVAARKLRRRMEACCSMQYGYGRALLLVVWRRR